MGELRTLLGQAEKVHVLVLFPALQALKPQLHCIGGDSVAHCPVYAQEPVEGERDVCGVPWVIVGGRRDHCQRVLVGEQCRWPPTASLKTAANHVEAFCNLSVATGEQRVSFRQASHE